MSNTFTCLTHTYTRVAPPHALLLHSPFTHTFRRVQWEFEQGFFNSGDDLGGDAKARWKERPTVHAGNVVDDTKWGDTEITD